MLNPKELESLKQLAAQLGKKLKEVPIELILGGPNGCSGDDEGHMTGLNLYDIKIADISFLRDFPRLDPFKFGQQ